jgi:hypothetical protein
MSEKSKYEFHETREQEAARKRVLKWWRKDCGWGRGEPVVAAPPTPEKRDGPGPLDPGELHAHGCEPSPSSKMPRYRSPGRPPSEGPILSRYQINKNYRERQKQIPCHAVIEKDGVQEKCGKPSWGGELCETCYRRKRRGVIPRLIEAMAQQEVQA